MESFYGGKQGASFIIKKTFTSVSAMNAAFNQKDVYKDVAYGEYVMIENTNMLDNTRGNVYKRGYNGAEYVGNFRGPQGVQGPVGPIGPTGSIGPTGPKGDAGTSWISRVVYDGTTGTYTLEVKTN